MIEDQLDRSLTTFSTASLNPLLIIKSYSAELKIANIPIEISISNFMFHKHTHVEKPFAIDLLHLLSRSSVFLNRNAFSKNWD